MPSYHLSAQVVQRSKGRNVVAMAAYRAGARLEDRGSGRVADYSRKRGVAHEEIMAPEGSAEWLRDRERLWNGVEAMEKRKDAQLAREINLALPAELDAAGRLELVRGFVQCQFVALGMVADVAIHEPVAERGDDPRNFHAHVLLTMRQATSQGLNPVKTREWNSDSLLQEWREAWAEIQNLALERAGHRERVDHRTLAAQRDEARERGDRVRAVELDRVAEIHEGPRARKAQSRARTPRSQSFQRQTARPRGGAWYSGKTPEKRKREVDYKRIDTGSRSEYSRSRVEARECETRQRQDKAERQMARMRDRQFRLEKSFRLTPVKQNRWLFRTTPNARDETDYLRRRQALARQLARELERLLIGLSARSRADRKRLTELVRVHDIRRVLEPGRERGRTR